MENILCKALDELLEVLEQQYACCNELLKLSERETNALKEDDIQGLFEVCKEINLLSQELGRLEEVRTEAHRRAAWNLGLAAETSLKQLIAAVRGQEEALADRLKEQATVLNSAYMALKEQNELNQLLLRQAADYADTIVTALHPDSKLTYSRGGAMYQRKISSPFVNRTV